MRNIIEIMSLFFKECKNIIFRWFIQISCHLKKLLGHLNSIFKTVRSEIKIMKLFEDFLQCVLTVDLPRAKLDKLRRDASRTT